MCRKKISFFFLFLSDSNKKMVKKVLVLFIASLLSLSTFAQVQSENMTKFQEEHQALQTAVQNKLTELEVEYEKEVAQITQNYKVEVAKVQTEYEGKLTKSVLNQEKYKKEIGKITNKYELLTKDVIFKSTVEKAKIENNYYHERKKLMDKYEIYLTD